MFMLAYPDFEDPDIVIKFPPDKEIEFVLRKDLQPPLLWTSCVLINALEQAMFPDEDDSEFIEGAILEE